MSKKSNNLVEKDTRIRDNARELVEAALNAGIEVPQATINGLYVNGDLRFPKNYKYVTKAMLKRDASSYNINSLKGKLDRMNVTKAIGVREAEGYNVNYQIKGVSLNKDMSSMLNEALGQLEKNAQVSQPNKPAGHTAPIYFHNVFENAGMQIARIAQEISGNKILNRGDDNDYYQIDDEWDGTFDTLPRHIQFKKVKISSKNMTPLNHIKSLMQIPYTSEKGMEEFEKQWKKVSYASNTDKNRMLASDYYEKLSGESKKILKGWKAEDYAALEDIMNESTVWRMCGAGNKTLDSDQVKDNWIKLSYRVKKAKKTGDEDVFDAIKTDLEMGTLSSKEMAKKIDRYFKTGKYE